MIDAARNFFAKEYSGPSRDDILRNLEAKHQSGHSFQKQLLNQGIFVLVEKTERGIRYDFPHRRFREVLATRYLDNPAKLQEVLANLGNQNYSEFLYVFFSISHFQDLVLRELLARVDASTEGALYGNLVFNCLERKPKDYDPTLLLVDFIQEKIASKKPFRLDRRILNYIIFTNEFTQWSAKRLQQGLENSDDYSVAVAGPVAAAANKKLMLDILNSAAEHALESNEIAGIFLKLVAIYNMQRFLKLLTRCQSRSYLFYLWCHVFISSPSLDGFENAKLYQRLKTDERILLLALSNKHNVNLDWSKAYKHHEEIECIFAFIRYARQTKTPKDETPFQKYKTTVYVVTSSIINMLEEETFREKLRPLAGKVFFDRTPIEKALPKDRTKIADNAQRDGALFNTVGHVVRSMGTEPEIPLYFQ